MEFWHWVFESSKNIDSRWWWVVKGKRRRYEFWTKWEVESSHTSSNYNLELFWKDLVWIETFVGKIKFNKWIGKHSDFMNSKRKESKKSSDINNLERKEPKKIKISDALNEDVAYINGFNSPRYSTFLDLSKVGEREQIKFNKDGKNNGGRNIWKINDVEQIGEKSHGHQICHAYSGPLIPNCVLFLDNGSDKIRCLEEPYK